MIRKLVSRLSKSVSEHKTSRRAMNVPICISIEPSRNTGKLIYPQERLSIRGETVDLSRSGISFNLSSIRIKEYYLVGEDRELKAELDLPNGKVQMKVIGRRYKQNDLHSSDSLFFIGASIVQMVAEDREIYEEFLQHKVKSKILELKPEQS